MVVTDGNPAGPGRRTFLVSGVAAAGMALAGGSVCTGLLPGQLRLRRLLGLTGPTGVVPSVPPSQVSSMSRMSRARGRAVTVISMTPRGMSASTLPVCVVLHGRFSDARGMVTLGLPRFLTAAVRSGVPPFTLVAVDGGDSYWVARDADDDPQRMLLEELPGWLTGVGLARETNGVPQGILGISMGCFGALVYDRRRAARPLEASALLSPAVFRSWRDASSVNGFAGEAQWAGYEPLRHLDELPRLTSRGVWCGREDPFWPAARQLTAGLRPSVAAFSDGGHDEGYWRRVLPDALRFVGQQMRIRPLGSPQ